LEILACNPAQLAAQSILLQLVNRPDNLITLLMLTMRILQARVKAIAEIVSELVAGVKEGRDVDLNNVKREVRIALHERSSMTGKDKSKDKTAS